MTSDTASFCEKFAQQFESINSLLKEHIADYDELLPHVFMADVSRFVLSGEKDRQQIVSYLERSLRDQSNDIKNLIAVSFVENFVSKQEIEQVLQGLDAYALWEEWHRQHCS